MDSGNLKDSDTEPRRKKNKTSDSNDAAEHAPRPSQSQPLTEVGDVDSEDFFDDNGNVWNPFASQVIRAVEKVKKPDHWPREFAKSIKERQEALLKELQVRSDAMTVSQQNSTSRFHGIIAAALAPAGAELIPASHPLEITHVMPNGQPIHDKCRILLEESKNLLTQYRTLAEQHSDTSHLEDLSQIFAAAKDQTAQAIAAGRRVADADIDHMLADQVHEVRGRQAITADDERLGRETLHIGRQQRPELAESDAERWGKVARRAQKAVEKLYKVAVMDE